MYFTSMFQQQCYEFLNSIAYQKKICNYIIFFIQLSSKIVAKFCSRTFTFDILKLFYITDKKFKPKTMISNVYSSVAGYGKAIYIIGSRYQH